MRRDERVTDEMVEAGQLAADALNVMVTAKAMRAALSAALSEQTLPVRVKELEAEPFTQDVMDDEDRTPPPEGFDAVLWQKADEVFNAMALIANDTECLKILYTALAERPGAEVRPVGYQQFKDGKWVECSYFVAFGWSDEIDKDCRPIYAHPPRSSLVDTSHASEEVVETWRPIETAPRDGSRVDIWLEPHDAMESGNAHRRPNAYFDRGDWWFTGNGVAYDVAASHHWTVTHWQPVPAPPALSSLRPAGVGSATDTKGQADAQ